MLPRRLAKSGDRLLTLDDRDESLRLLRGDRLSESRREVIVNKT